ncbi:unnamed protein product, partial [Didymodactylos carnosus]
TIEIGDVISLTPCHLIPIVKNGVPLFVYAEKVTTDDCIYISIVAQSMTAKVKSAKHEIKFDYCSLVTANGFIYGKYKLKNS